MTPTEMRAAALAQIAADIHMHGLPAPMTVNLSTGEPLPMLQLVMDNDEPVAVDLWAKHLDLGEPTEKEVGYGDTAFVARKANRIAHEPDGRWNGWAWVEVWCALLPEVAP